MQTKFNFRVRVLTLGVMAALCGVNASAQSWTNWSENSLNANNAYNLSNSNSTSVSSGGVLTVTGATINMNTAASTVITGNNDGSIGTEGVFIRSNNANSASGFQNYLGSYVDVVTNGVVNVGGAASINLASSITNITGALTQIGNASINSSGTASTSIGNATGSVSVTGTTSINSSGTASTIIGNTTGTGTVSINGASNSMTAVGANTITGATNVITATTSNTMSANAANGTNNITANATTGTNNINARNNNIGTTGTSVNALGNTDVSTTVTARGGNTTLSLANNTASMTAGTTLATNGVDGISSGTGSGGLTVYNAAQSIGNSTTIGNTLDGKTYQNKINGNLLVDGNVYINGTLNYVSSNSANTAVIGSTAALTSNIAGATVATSGGTAIIMKGATGTQTVVDTNGKLTNVTGQAEQSSASLTLTNGIGNTHGLVVQEDKTSISGGVNSSTLTMADNGATFSDAATGAPVQVHGVNDGTSNFDAVNVRQFSSAIASVTAMANIPQVDQDKTYAYGVGVGGFMGKTALAAGVTYRFTKNGVFKASVSSAMNSSDSTTVGFGAAWSY